MYELWAVLKETVGWLSNLYLLDCLSFVIGNYSKLQMNQVIHNNIIPTVWHIIRMLLVDLVFNDFDLEYYVIFNGKQLSAFSIQNDCDWYQK